jgi:signal transduction histidine kinase
VTTLRAKLAVLVAGVIIAMVLVLTGVLLLILRPPHAEQGIPALADHVQLLERIANANPSLVTMRPTPAGGAIVADTTSMLRYELAARGIARDVLVTQGSGRGEILLSVPLAQGWVASSIVDLPPQGGVMSPILMWLAVIALGAMFIALFLANRMVEPLVLLERAVETVGSDAVLPELAVKGPAEIQATARALNSLSSRLKAAMESRMRLVAAAGHDLRTPITRMRLRAEFVENDDDRAMWLKDIDELSRIADSAILLVREEAGKSTPEAIRLDKLVSELVTDLRSLSFDVTVVVTAAAIVRANQASLKRALSNLLINSATYGSRARIKIESTEADAIVVIEDDGPGIPQDLLGQVFEPFFRAHPSRAKNIEGTGLGLTIANEIVQRAGGSIVIENGASCGLLQTVTLPLAKLSANQSAP